MAELNKTTPSTTSNEVPGDSNPMRASLATAPTHQPPLVSGVAVASTASNSSARSKSTRFGLCSKADTRKPATCSNLTWFVRPNQHRPRAPRPDRRPQPDPRRPRSRRRARRQPVLVKRFALEAERDPDTKNPLHGTRDENNRWQFSRAELDRFAASRLEKKVVVASDVTVSFEKSISLAWARASTDERRTIEAVLDEGTNAAVAYLEDHAVAVRRGRGAERADGVWAASYRHLTNRNLEPQLHDHVVIANIGAADGRTQALDSRLLHHPR